MTTRDHGQSRYVRRATLVGLAPQATVTRDAFGRVKPSGRYAVTLQGDACDGDTIEAAVRKYAETRKRAG